MDILLIALAIVVGVYLFLVECWFSYIAVMRLKQMRNDGTLSQLGRFALMSAYTGLGIALVKDAILVLIFSLILWTLPREFTLTAMLKRLQTQGGRRATAAAWLCKSLLNQFDLSGPHC
jgi:hypothetical protein